MKVGQISLQSTIGAMLLATLYAGGAAWAYEALSPVQTLGALDVIHFESSLQSSWPAEYKLDGRVAAVSAEEELPDLPAGEQIVEPPIDPDDSIVYFGKGPPGEYTFGYNKTTSAMTWLPGHNDRFGWFSVESFGSFISINDWPDVVLGYGVHFIDGPVRTDMPPRLFDFPIGLSDRRLIQPNIGYDILFGVGVYSDFEGSAEKGVRFPGHAVTFWRLTPTWEFVLGIDYLDRDDISLLPVAGLIWNPTDFFRVEAVFPRPRMAVRCTEGGQWLYVAGELGGGTWAIERVNLADDNATYRDLRLLLGIESRFQAISNALEVGYVFGRDLSYRSGIGDYEPEDAMVLRLTTRY